MGTALVNISALASGFSCWMALLFSKSVPTLSGELSANPEMADMRAMDAQFFYGPLEALSALFGLVLFGIGFRSTSREWRFLAGGLLAVALIGIWLNFFVPVDVVPGIR